MNLSLTAAASVPSESRPGASWPSLLLAAIAALATPAAFAFDSGSTGADGALNPAVNTDVQLPPSGVLNYTSINIPAGVTVRLRPNAPNTPAYILVSGNATIAGTLSALGEDARPSGAAGDGNSADDGVPGAGGPGGYAGGRGGGPDPAQVPAVIRGGAGLGPGGGKGGIEGNTTCVNGMRYYKHVGLGASYSSVGGDGWLGYGCSSTYQTPDQAKAYGSIQIQPMIGGSGGGGGRGGTSYAGSGGGGGGGAILLAVTGTASITGAGNINVTGGDAGDVSAQGVGGEGAGGSGGAIRLVATTVSGNGALYANGGCRVLNGTKRQNCWNSASDSRSGGSPGRIRIEAETTTYTGTTQPAYATGRPDVIFVANPPSLRIASVAGAAVPANPTGNGDVALPANTPNPVTVAFTTTNIPTGNTVLLRVVPASGDYIEALSPAITGSTASGSTSVNVNLPQGPSTLLAITSYTVTVAMGEALSQFAENERVERVELVAGLGGPATANLITVSGKRHEVPASVLQLAAYAGWRG